MLGLFKKILGINSPRLSDLIQVDSFLVDVRTSGEFSGGSVQGAVNIPLNQIQKQIATFKNKKNIVVFCASGVRSSQAKRILEQNGIQNVINGGSWRAVYKVVG